MYPWDAMLARVQAIALCLSVWICVCHKSMFYRKGWTEWSFWHAGFFRSVLHCVMRKFRYPQNNGTSLGNYFFQTPDLENFAMVYRSMERVINLARERWTLRAWQTGLSWQYFRASTLDCCSLSQSDTDSQATSTARFRREGQLATADTCYYSDYWNYEMWVNLQTTVKLGLWIISEILNRPKALKKTTSKRS